jgi:hypothetical protein
VYLWRYLLSLRNFFVSASPKSVLGSVLRGLAWLLFAAAAVFFLAGGVLIHELAGLPGELGGIVLAVVLSVLGWWAESAAKKVSEREQGSS